jgi:hypothetical protein
MRFSVKLTALLLIAAGTVTGIASTISTTTSTAATTYSTNGLIWE